MASHLTNLVVEQVDLALDEVVRLQEEGPSDQDVSTVLEIEQRAHENGLQVNFLLMICVNFFASRLSF